MMRFVVCATAAMALGCASGGGSAPEGGVRDIGTVQIPGGAGSKDSRGGASGAGAGTMTLYTSADVGMMTTVPAPVDAAYSALTKGYLSLGIDLATRDPGAHVIGNRHIVVMHEMFGHRLSAFFECGIDPVMGTQRADTYRLTYSVVSTLSSADAGQSRVTTLVTAQAADLATSASTVYCSSTGLMERTLLKASGFQPD